MPVTKKKKRPEEKDNGDQEPIGRSEHHRSCLTKKKPMIIKQPQRTFRTSILCLEV